MDQETLKAREQKLLADMQTVIQRIEADKQLLQRMTGALSLLREMQALEAAPSPAPIAE